MSERVLDAVTKKFGDAILKTHSQFGDDTLVVDPKSWKAICRFLRDDPQMSFDMFVDLCGVDYPTRTPRIDVVLHLYSVARRHRVRVKTAIGDEDMETCELDSIADIWVGANWFERETYDLVGVTFKGHPDLRRILMYPEFVGHPLLKDYPADRVQPLVPYREIGEAGQDLRKQLPFGPDEGMPFGRHVLGQGPATTRPRGES